MYGWLYNLINVSSSLVGYYLAAAFIDDKFYGRRRVQSVGFLADFLCFIIPASLYDPLLKPGAGLAAFQFLYFFSSFWYQFGPNATTFLVAAECHSASVRSTAHGVSAAWGRLSALAPCTQHPRVRATGRVLTARSGAVQLHHSAPALLGRALVRTARRVRDGGVPAGHDRARSA
jgi:hypothetical protein